MCRPECHATFDMLSMARRHLDQQCLCCHTATVVGMNTSGNHIVKVVKLKYKHLCQLHDILCTTKCVIRLKCSLYYVQQLQKCMVKE